MKKILLLALVVLSTFCTAQADLTETVVLQNDFEKGETLFEPVSRISVSNKMSSDIGSKVVHFRTDYNSINGYSFATVHFGSKTAGARKVKIEFDFYMDEVNPNYAQYFTIRDGNAVPEFGKTVYSDGGAFFYLGECRSGQGVNYWSINGDYTSKDTKSYFNKWLHVMVLVDVKGKSVDYTITTKDRGIVLNEAKEIPFANKRAMSCSQIDFFADVNSTDAYFDNLVITKYSDPSSVPTSYNVTFKDKDGAVLKPKMVYFCNVGETFMANELDLNTFFNKDGNVKYIYKSGNIPGVAVRSGRENNINLVFDAHHQIDYSVKAMKGTEELGIAATGKGYIDGTSIAAWNKYIKHNGMWYETVAPYSKYVDSEVSEVQYRDAYIEYFFECEDLTMSHAAAATEIHSGYSGSQAPRHYGYTTPDGVVTTSYWSTPALERGGIFTMKIPYTRSSKTNSTINICIQTPDGEIKDTGRTLTSVAQEGLFKVDNLEIPDGCALVLYNKVGKNSNIYMDYIALSRK
ncbi:MAG: hypothetical protein KBT34_03440 [Prevotella sp.]|nr:hypothetical protein [Candidatus Prevotella equi]